MIYIIKLCDIHIFVLFDQYNCLFLVLMNNSSICYWEYVEQKYRSSASLRSKRVLSLQLYRYFLKNILTKFILFVIIRDVHRGLVQSVEHRSPKPSVVGSSPPAPAKKKSRARKQATFLFVLFIFHYSSSIIH